MTAKLRTVAVGFDGSADSMGALRWAADLCESIGATLLVIHVVGLLEERHLTGHPPVTVEAALPITEAAGLPADRVEYTQLSGSPADALLRVTGPPHSVDLLVLGSRGIGASGRLPEMLLGSTSLEVAQLSPIPVTVVPRSD
jgi:nucleotide-binding universal stress UspA family protein